MEHHLLVFHEINADQCKLAESMKALGADPKAIARELGARVKCT
jgi:hypothetical protein